MATDTQLKILISSLLDNSGFDKANKSIGDIGVSLKSLERVAKTAAESITGYFTFKYFKDSIKGALDYAEAINHVRQSSGMSADQLFALNAAAKLADVDFESLTKMTSKFEKGIGEASMGTGNAKIALDHLGLSLRDSQGHMIGSYDQLSKIADKFKEMPDGASKTTMAMELFGKSGAAMIPILNGGSQAMQEYLGFMDDKTAQAAENFNDSMTRVSMASNSVYMQMTAALAPTLNAVANDLNSAAKEGRNTGHTLGSDLAEGMKVAINLAYGFAAAFNISGHILGNFGAAASMLAAGDFKGAQYAWSQISKDFNADIDSWGARMAKIQNAKPSDIDAQTGGTGKDLGFEDKEAERLAEQKAKKEAEAALKIQNAYASMYAELYKISHNDYENEILQIDDKAKKYRQEVANFTEKAKAKKYLQDVENFTEKAKADLKAKYTAKADEEALEAIKKFNEEQAKLEFEADQGRKEALKTYNAGLITAQIDYYTAIGDTSSAYYLQEEEKIKKLAETGWYTNEQMLAIKTADNEKFQKEQWAKDNKFWVDLFDNINKAMDDQFFNAMTGKFKSFGSWLKDFWGSISSSMARGLSKSLADSILGTGSSGGGLVNVFKSFGMFTGATGSAGTLAGTTLSASDYASVVNKYGSVAGMTVTPDGTTIDNTGKITSMGTGSDLGSMLNIASSAKTAYTAIAGGISSSIADAFASGAAYTYDGLTAIGVSADTAGGIAGGIGNFGAGFSSPWASAGAGGAEGAGAMLGGAALGAAGGYAIGSIGDKLFGAKTKAATYGAIGGAIGSLAGPIGAIAGAAIGSIIGGMFGSTKTTGSGYYFDGETTTGSNGQSYIDYKKKSWFKSSSWTDYQALSDVDKNKIKELFDTYDYLIVQLGRTKKISIDAGRYAGTTFQDQLAKNFITAFTDVDQSSAIFSTIYNYWVDYAKSINKTVAEALTSSVGTYISETRTFQEWKLGSGTTEQLKFTKDYLSKDLSALEDQIGVSGVTVDNYLSMYDEAIKKNFTPETINSWKNLGEALVNAANANKKYTDSLNALTENTQTIPRTFQEWKLGSGTTEQLKFTADYLSKDLSALEAKMGVSGVTVDNYLSMYDEAINKNFTQENINSWKNLGEALISATNANKKYTDSLKALTENTKAIPQDMILSKSLDGSQLFSTISTQADTMKYSFAEMISLLRKMLYNQQFGVQPI